MLAPRDAHPCWGTAKLGWLLAQQGSRRSASMIGRILRSARRRTRLIAPHAVRVRQPRSPRPSATRLPKATRAPTQPGALMAQGHPLDTMHPRPLPTRERRQFTAIDVVSRVAVVGVRSTATASTATAFLAELEARMPFSLPGIHVDGGSEFMASGEAACQARGIARYVLPPRSPTLTGRVERRNGTARRECWEWYEGEVDLPTVQDALPQWEVSYTTERPHHALGYATPQQHLAQLLSHMS